MAAMAYAVASAGLRRLGTGRVPKIPKINVQWLFRPCLPAMDLGAASSKSDVSGSWIEGGLMNNEQYRFWGSWNPSDSKIKV